MDDQLPDVVPAGPRAPRDLVRIDRTDCAPQIRAMPGAPVVGLVEQREQARASVLAHRAAASGAAFAGSVAFGAAIAITCFMLRM
jgi:hypothetical protein